MSFIERRRAERPPLSQLLLVETCWRVVNRGGHQVLCGLYQGRSGYEARVGNEREELLRSGIMRDAHEARSIAAAWRLCLVRSGRFVEVPIS